MKWFVNAIRETAFVPKESELHKSMNEAMERISKLEAVCKSCYAAIEHLEGRLLQLRSEVNTAKKRDQFILNQISGGSIPLPEQVRTGRQHGDYPTYSHIRYLPAFRLAVDLSEKGWLQEDIAAALNAKGFRTAKSKQYSQAIVSMLLSNRFLRSIYEREQEAAKQNRP